MREEASKTTLENSSLREQSERRQHDTQVLANVQQERKLKCRISNRVIYNSLTSSEDLSGRQKNLEMY